MVICEDKYSKGNDFVFVLKKDVLSLIHGKFFY